MSEEEDFPPFGMHVINRFTDRLEEAGYKYEPPNMWFRGGQVVQTHHNPDKNIWMIYYVDPRVAVQQYCWKPQSLNGLPEELESFAFKRLPTTTRKWRGI